MPKNSSNTTFTTARISPTITKVNEEEAQSLHRVRRRLTWMEDYEVTEIGDSITRFALFSGYDLTTFESAIKEEKWQKAMDDEINAIERNDT